MTLQIFLLFFQIVSANVPREVQPWTLVQRISTPSPPREVHPWGLVQRSSNRDDSPRKVDPWNLVRRNSNRGDNIRGAEQEEETTASVMDDFDSKTARSSLLVEEQTEHNPDLTTEKYGPSLQVGKTDLVVQTIHKKGESRLKKMEGMGGVEEVEEEKLGGMKIPALILGALENYSTRFGGVRNFSRQFHISFQNFPQLR